MVNWVHWSVSPAKSWEAKTVPEVLLTRERETVTLDVKDEASLA